MAFNPGRNIGRVSIRAMPDTRRFRADLRRQLEVIERTTTMTVRVDKANVDRNQLRESIRRQMAEFKDLDVASKVSVTVDTVKIKRSAIRKSIQSQFDELGDIRVHIDPVITEVAKKEFSHDVNQLVRHNSGKNIDVGVNAHSTAASAQMRYVTRPRFIDIFVRINQGSLNRAMASLAALSGARLTWKWIDTLIEKAGDLDRTLPSIVNWTTGITSLFAAVAGSVSGLVGIGQGLFTILPAFLVIPGLFLNAVGSLAVLFVALRNAKTELGSLGAGFTDLGRIINTRFWAQARQPILDLVNGLMPQMRNAFSELSDGVGGFVGALSNGFAKSLAGGRFESIFANVSEGWRILSTGADAFAGAITSLSQIAARYTPRLARWFVRQADTFDAWLNNISNDGRLDQWMETAIDSMYDLWDATTGVAGVFANIWKAADQAGSGGLAGFADMLQEWKRVTGTARFQTGLAAVFRGSYVAMDAFGKAIGAIGDLFADMPKQFERFIGSAGSFLGGLIEGIFVALNNSNFAIGLDGFSQGLDDALSGILPSLQPIADTFGSFVGLLGDLAANLLPLAAGVIADLMPGVQTLIDGVKTVLPDLADATAKVSDTLAPVVNDLVEAFSPALISALQSFADIAPPLAETVGGLGEMLVPLGDALSGFWEGWTTVVTGAAAAVDDWSWLWDDDQLNSITDSLIEAGGWFGEMMRWATEFDAEFVRVTDNFTAWVAGLGPTLILAAASAGSWLVDTGIAVTAGLLAGILTGAATVIQWVAGLGATLAASAAGAITWLNQTGVSVMAGLLAGILLGVASVTGWFANLPATIKGAIGDVKWMLVSVGSDMIAGLVAGIKLAAGAVATAAVNVVKTAVNAASAFLQIRSPSRLTRDRIGKQWAAGVAVGIEQGAPGIALAAKSAVDLKPTLGAVVGGSSESARVTAGAQITITQPLLPGETPQEQRDNLVKELAWVY